MNNTTRIISMGNAGLMPFSFACGKASQMVGGWQAIKLGSCNS